MLDMRPRAQHAAFAGALCRRPSGVQPIGGCHRKQTDIAVILPQIADGGDRFRCDCTLIDNDQLAIRPRRPQQNRKIERSCAKAKGEPSGD